MKVFVFAVVITILWLFALGLTVAASVPVSAVRVSVIPEEDKIANVGDLGKIRGFETETNNTKKPYLHFLGIPYGIITTRFGHSNLREGALFPDDQVFNATQFGQPCPQTNAGHEHCLFLNIATHDVKNISPGNLRPVILFVHGAAFVAGNANAYTGELLLKRDVVVVSFNYRLGVFGFFCLNTEDVPCNGALYDAISALKWVQKYIRYFGGNPDSVTLIGQSSGSASVSHILLSPMAKGLFHRAMTLSGTAINEWALAADPRKSSLRVAELCNCYVPGSQLNLTAISNCMKTTANQSIIIRAQDTYQAEERMAGRLGFDAVNPAVQTPDGMGSTPLFLHDHPLAILNRSEQVNVPLMLGATKHDGAFGIAMLLGSYLIPNGNLQNDPIFLKKHLIPIILSSLGIPDDTGGIYETIGRTYLDETRLSGNFTVMMPGLVDMASVFYFKAAAYKNALLHSKLNSTYFYSFDFAGTKTNQNPILPIPNIAAHADDLIYVFPIFNIDFNEPEQKISDTMIDYWVNFATTGEPGKYPDGSGGDLVPWPKFTEESTEYLIIDKEMRADNDYPSTWKSTPLVNTSGRKSIDKFMIASILIISAAKYIF